MPRKRLSATDRRTSILNAATTVFAMQGFDGAKTQQIAAAAQVSEALVYRHFSSKTALYRAVLRKLVQDQNSSFASFGSTEPNAGGILTVLEYTFRNALRGERAGGPQALRLLFASLTGDGHYARLTYRRAKRLATPELLRALDAAQAAGEITGPPVNVGNIIAFVEHISSMMLASRLSAQSVVSYVGNDDAVVHEAVLFCARGIGMREDVIVAHLEKRSVSMVKREEGDMVNPYRVRPGRPTRPSL